MGVVRGADTSMHLKWSRLTLVNLQVNSLSTFASVCIQLGDLIAVVLSLFGTRD